MLQTQCLDKSLYHQNMQEILMKEFPKLRLKQINFLKNRISNSLRKIKFDIHEVYISARPLSLSGYIHSYVVTGTGVSVNVYIVVD